MCAWLCMDMQVHLCAGACLHIHAAKYTFHLETVILIQLTVDPYEIAPGKYLHYSMLIGSLMAGAACSIVVR